MDISNWSLEHSFNINVVNDKLNIIHTCYTLFCHVLGYTLLRSPLLLINSNNLDYLVNCIWKIPFLEWHIVWNDISLQCPKYILCQRRMEDKICVGVMVILIDIAITHSLSLSYLITLLLFIDTKWLIDI